MLMCAMLLAAGHAGAAAPSVKESLGQGGGGLNTVLAPPLPAQPLNCLKAGEQCSVVAVGTCCPPLKCAGATPATRQCR